MNTITKALERLNRPQMRRDFIGENYKLVLLLALIACALIAGAGQ